MKYLLSTALGCALIFAAAPAFAQLSAGGNGAPNGTPTPQPRVPDIAPTGVPGAGDAPVATGPEMQKPISGDPTQALFAAVNSGDYSGAQDALSRGANISATNELGETPLDLAIALNRSSITFIILAARNETGGDTTGAGPILSAPAAAPPATHHHWHATPVTDTPAPPPPTLGNNPGTPDPAAGFMGFGPRS